MKLRVPDHISGLSIEGMPLDIAADRSIEVSDHHAMLLIEAHGLEAFDKAAFEMESATRDQLIAKATDIFRAGLNGMSDDDLRREISFNMQRSAPQPSEPKKLDDMNRAELFAFLKEHGVAAPATMSNEALLQAAKDTADKVEGKAKS